jgi:toxin ParE1/3/4
MGHRLAPHDLEEIWSYICDESGSEAIADRLIDSPYRPISAACQSSALRGGDGIPCQGLRSFPVGGYVVLYRVQGADVRILRVLHGRRDLDALLRR